jgi:hypothetical protein
MVRIRVCSVCDLSKKSVGVGLISLFWGGAKIRRGDCGAERAQRASSRAKPEHIRLGGLGERRKLPSGVRGGAPAAIDLVQSKAKSSIESELNELNNITFLKIS